MIRQCPNLGFIDRLPVTVRAPAGQGDQGRQGSFAVAKTRGSVPCQSRRSRLGRAQVDGAQLFAPQAAGDVVADVGDGRRQAFANRANVATP